MGSPGVGKSAVMTRFKDDIFSDSYNPTIQASYKKIFEFNKEKVELEIVDYEGQSEYTIFLHNKFSYGIHGYILMYSIENLQSFELISTLNSKLSTYVSKDIPRILVANKMDLTNKRIISYEHGADLARDLNCPFLECSAKANANIYKVFNRILIEINKYEDHVDFKNYGCTKVYEFFIQNEVILLKVYYFLIFINLCLAILFIIFGFIFGLKNS